MLSRRLQALGSEVLRTLLRGIEKESLRVNADGTLATTPHPAALGSPLTHPHITTDFSESQLELITGAHRSIDDCRRELWDIHQFVYRNIGDEMLWCASMPCKLPADEEIPIGQYGSSNIGRAKTVYRHGLSYRYGRRMQTISGIHYNFSLPDSAWPSLQALDGRRMSERDYRTVAYFSLIRNFRRHSWLLLYLFGASPAVCESFVAGRTHGLRELNGGTLYLPGATSLRMGPLGYQSDAQAALAVSYNNLESYARSLYGALTQPYPPYAAIGIRDGEQYRQLSTSLLQIENEFYGTIRPKRRIRKGERPLHALGERGVEYVEVRCMDLDPFCPIGIAADTMRFLDVFLLFCLLDESPPDTMEELNANARNQMLVAQRGRDSGLRLRRLGEETDLRDWGKELVRGCEPVAAAVDTAFGSHAYGDVLAAAASALDDPARTPSARILAEMAREHDNSYLRFALVKSRAYRDEILAAEFAAETETRFVRLAAESIAERREIEAQDTISFEIWRQQYLAQDLLGGIRLKSTA
jgi:glutamate--cysteine ligase